MENWPSLVSCCSAPIFTFILDACALSLPSLLVKQSWRCSPLEPVSTISITQRDCYWWMLITSSSLGDVFAVSFSLPPPYFLKLHSQAWAPRETPSSRNQTVLPTAVSKHCSCMPYAEWDLSVESISMPTHLFCYNRGMPCSTKTYFRILIIQCANVMVALF